MELDRANPEQVITADMLDDEILVELQCEYDEDTGYVWFNGYEDGCMMSGYIGLDGKVVWS